MHNSTLYTDAIGLH